MKRALMLVVLFSLAACSESADPPAAPGDDVTDTPDVVDPGDDGASPDEGDPPDGDGPDVPDTGDSADTEVVEPPAWTGPEAWTVRISPDAPAAVAIAAGDVVEYLGAMGRYVIDDESTGEVTCEEGGQVVFAGDGLGDDAMEGEPEEQTFAIVEERCEGGVLVTLKGGGVLGRQYAAYEWLHWLGVRFFHPEQEFVPQAPQWSEEPLVRQHTPAFQWRSVSLHLAHPLELGDVFRLHEPEHEAEAGRYIDWQIKNLASFGTEGGPGEFAGYGVSRGLPRSTGFSLYNQQQGSSGIIDPDSPLSADEQIVAAIDQRMGGESTPDFFSFTFNPTEFTEVDDQLVVQQMTLIANHIGENYPSATVQATNHGTHGEPTDHYGVRYYDLPKFAPPNLGVKVHTLMFFDLFRPAPVYGNEDFSFLYDFMEETYETRDLWYFPESAWWLTFDIAVPLYLPITIEARDRDIEGLAHMLAGGLNGHRVFGSGHEWGYWQNEYCSFRMSADLAYRWTDCLADITSPMGEAAAEVQAVLEDQVEIQERDLIYGDILPYLAGSDPETEAAAAIGIHFHDLSPKPASIMGWSLAECEDWEETILVQLKTTDTDQAALLARLEAVEDLVPEEAGPWFREIRDGVAINGLRARHAWQAFGAAVTMRKAVLTADAALETQAWDLLDDAKATTGEAIALVHAREQDYRYQPVSRAIAGGPEGGEDENWTIYPYRYLNRAHHGYYYVRTDSQVEEALSGTAGQQNGVLVDDVLLAPGETLTLTLTDPALGSVQVDFGDEATEVVTSPGTVTHTYESAGAYTVQLTALDEEATFEKAIQVAQVDQQLTTGLSGAVQEPEGASLIDGVIPGLVLGPVGDEQVAVGFDFDGGNAVAAGWLHVVDRDGDAFFGHVPVTLVTPIVTGGDVLTTITLSDAVVLMADATSGPALSAELLTDDLVAAIVDVGGFEETGAKQLIASLTGYTPETLPEALPFTVTWELE